MDLFIYFGALRGLRRIAESVLLVADSSSLSLNEDEECVTLLTSGADRLDCSIRLHLVRRHKPATVDQCRPGHWIRRRRREIQIISL